MPVFLLLSYYSRPRPQASDQPYFVRLPRLWRFCLRLWDGSCFTGLVWYQNLPLTCKHDESEPDTRPAVNSNAYYHIFSGAAKPRRSIAVSSTRRVSSSSAIQDAFCVSSFSVMMRVSW